MASWIRVLACVAPAFEVAVTIAVHVLGALSYACITATVVKAPARSFIIAAQVPAIKVFNLACKCH